MIPSLFELIKSKIIFKILCKIFIQTPVVVFGVAKIRLTKLTATLSGLKLEGEIRGLQSSVHYKEKIRAPMKGVVEASVMGNMQVKLYNTYA